MRALEVLRAWLVKTQELDGHSVLLEPSLSPCYSAKKYNMFVSCESSLLGCGREPSPYHVSCFHMCFHS